MRPKAELVRIVKPKDSAAAIDLTYKVEGRGAYVCKSGECIAGAKKRRVFERSFRGAVNPQVYEELENLTELN